MMQPLVSIVILNWNGKPLLEKTIQSAISTNYPNKEIILVDNGSIDGSASYVQKKFGKRVRVLKLSQNIGFTGGHNYGFRNAKGKFVFMLTNDVTLPKTCLKPLVDKMVKNKELGIVFPIVYGCDNAQTKFDYCYGNVIDVLGHELRGDANNVYLFTPAGPAFLIRKSYYAEPFINELFVYGDETCLGFKTWLKGFKILLEKKVKVLHAGSFSTREYSRSGISIYYAERNGILNSVLFYSSKTFILLMPIFIIELILRFLRVLISLDQKQLKNRIKAYVWILTHIAEILELRVKIKKELGKTNDIHVLQVMSYGKFGEVSVVRKIIGKFYQLYMRFLLKAFIH